MPYEITPPAAQSGYQIEPPPAAPTAPSAYKVEPPAKTASAYSVEPPQGSGFLSQVGDAAALPFKAAGKGLKNIAKETMKEGVQNAEDIKGDFTAPIQGEPKKGVGNYVSRDFKSKGTEAPGVMDYAARAGKTALDLVNRPFVPLHAASKATVGAASEAHGGPKAETVANATDLLVPFGGEVKQVAKMGAEAVGKGGRKILSVLDSPVPPGLAAEIKKMKAEQAAAKAAVSPKPPVGVPSKSGMPTEGPLTESPALKEPRKFEDQLFQLESNRVADKLDIKKAVSAAPDVPAATWEKLYHHEENPAGVTLTPEEKAIYDQHVAPLKAEADGLHKELEGFGYDTGEGGKNYTPRYVAGKTRSFGEVLDQWKKGVESKFQGGAAARSMRQTVDAQKSRRFYNAVSPDGEKFVVHIGKDGKISAFDPDGAGPEFGTFPKGQKLAPGSKIRAEGNTWRLEQATTKEIEDVASTRYHKNVLANRLDNIAKLRSAVRNAKFIEGMKSSPEWPNVAQKTNEVLEPPVTNGRTWRTPKTPQLQNYYMEPTLADALDDAAGRTRDLDGLENGVDRMGNLIKGSIFWNPIPHIRNVANHYFVDKGLVGGTVAAVKGAAKLATGGMPATLRAARAVMTQNEDYMKALRAGGSLPYARLITRDLHKALTTKLGESVAANPTQWDRIAKIGGYANPIEMVKAVYKGSNHLLWGAGDIMTVARYMDRMEKGLPLSKAIKATEEHMPNYRVPGQVMGQRLMSQLLTSPIATMFGRYQYNRLASYMHMAKEMVSKESSIKDKAATLDKLAALGVMLTLYYPALDKAWQGITGNENAKVTRPGAASVPQAAIELAKGEKTPSQAATSTFSPGVVEAPIEAFHGRYLYSGQPIAYPENLTDGHPDQFARDIGAWIGSKISPVGQAQKIMEGGQSPQQFMLSQIGVQSPTDRQVAGKAKFKQRDEKMARRRAVKKANQRGE